MTQRVLGPPTGQFQQTPFLQKISQFVSRRCFTDLRKTSVLARADAIHKYFTSDSRLVYAPGPRQPLEALAEVRAWEPRAGSRPRAKAWRWQRRALNARTNSGKLS